MARRPLALPPAVLERWCQYGQGEVSHIAEATGFVNFEISFDGQRECRVVTPQHYIIAFVNREKGRQRYNSSFLTISLAPERSLPEQVQVGVEVRGRDGESVICGGEYVEFELLSLVNDASKQPSLRIAAGPVRINPETEQREFMRIDLGRCVRQIVTDIVDDPRHKGQKLVRSRWWICVEVLRLVSSANSLDCSALDKADAAPLEWVICLVDEKSGSGGGTDEKSVDELAKFIDGGGKKSKARKKKKARGGDDAADEADEAAFEDAAEAAEALAPSLPAPNGLAAISAAAAAAEALAAVLPGGRGAGFPLGGGGGAGSSVLAPAAPTPTRAGGGAGGRGGGVGAAVGAATALRTGPGAVPPRPAPPPGWSRTVDLPPALVDAWRDCAGCDVRHVAESTGFLHFALSRDGERHRHVVAPVHHIVAFPHLGVGQQRYHSALLTLRVVPDSEIPDDTEGAAAGESVEFELLARENEAPVKTPLCFTAGPVRINEKTGQRESLRLDLGESVRWAAPDLIRSVVGGGAQQLVRQRWWISIETLRLICVANSLDCLGLDECGAPPLEWVACLVDERAPLAAAAGRSLDMPPAACALGGTASAITTAEVLRALAESLPIPGGGGAGGLAAAPPCSAAAAKPRATRRERKKTAPPSGPSAAATGSPPSATAVAAPRKEPTDEMATTIQDAKRPAGSKPAAPSRTLALPSALIDSWCQFARKKVTHVSEATGFVHFELSFDKDNNHRVVSPEHYIIAFPNRDKGRQRYHSSLLTLRIVKESDIPAAFVIPRPQTEQGNDDPAEHVEFELLLRVHEAPVQQQLRITAGPVRVSPSTGQRESMRIDLGRCVRQISTDVVDDPRGKRVVRNRWWICVELLRLVCTANSLDCKALDEPGHPPVEWVVCLVDERTAGPSEAPEAEEQRDIDELLNFIDGKGDGAKKKRKNRKANAKEEEWLHPAVAAAQAAEAGCAPASSSTSSAATVPMSASQVAAAALSQAALSQAPHVHANHGGGTGGLTAAAAGLAGHPTRGPHAVDPAVQVQAACQLLAEAAASSTSPRQAAAAAAAAEVARRAASTAAPDAAAAAAALVAEVGAAPRAAPAPRRLPDATASAASAAARARAAAAAAAASAASRQPLLANWEPAPLPPPAGLEEDEAAYHASLGLRLSPDITSPRGLAGLESLLAGLRSEFAGGGEVA